MKVSIIIRMRNEAYYLRSTLDALVRQEFPEGFEIIIVDNCSTDNSVQIVKEYTDKIITIEKPCGVRMRNPKPTSFRVLYPRRGVLSAAPRILNWPAYYR